MQQLAVSHSPTPARVESAVCRGLGRQAATHLVAISSLVARRPGEVVFCEGDDAECVYEVVSGTLRLYKLLPDGRRQITGFPSTGHLLGLAPDGEHVYSAEAVTAVTLCRYPRASFNRLIDSVPGLARRLWAVTSDELRLAQDQLLLLGRKTASEKVASFLLMLADASDDGDEIALPMRRGDIGDYLGLTIETVSRTLTEMKRDRLLALPTSDSARLLDRERLEALAGGAHGASV